MSDSHPTESRTVWSRRQALAATGTALTLGIAGCLASPPGSSELESQFETVREATADYEDPTAALEAGFTISGPYVPGMGWHFTHPGRLEAAAEDGFTIEEPPLLTYLEGEDGLVLGSVEYGAPAEAVDEPDLFDDENADATEEWHQHAAATHVFATGDGEANDPQEIAFEEWVTKDNWAEFHPPDRELSAGDTVSLNWGSPKGKEGDRTERVADLVTTHPALTTLHVWVHAENPEGPFHPTNPEFGGDDGHDH